MAAIALEQQDIYFKSNVYLNEVSAVEAKIKKDVEARYRKYNPEYIVAEYDRSKREGSATFNFGQSRKTATYGITRDGSPCCTYGPEDDVQGGLDLYWRPQGDPYFGVKQCCVEAMENFPYDDSKFNVVQSKSSVNVSTINLECKRCGSKWDFDQSVSPAKWSKSK